MSSLSPKDRVSLCMFSFADGRRCRTPRTRNNPRFCFYHTQKEARARTAQKLGKDLAYFFSGDYLSACDLSTALARLIPAVVRGDVKSKTAPPTPSLIWSKPSCRPSTSPSTNTSTLSARTAGANPSATPSTATTTTAFRPPPNPSPDAPSPNPPNLNPSPPQPNNRPHRRTLRCLPRAPNSFGM